MLAQADDAFRPPGRQAWACRTRSGPLQAVYAASEAYTSLLVTSFREQTGLDVNLHARHAGQQRRLARLNQAAADERRSNRISAASDTATQKRMVHAKETGTWLITMPDCLNGTFSS